MDFYITYVLHLIIIYSCKLDDNFDFDEKEYTVDDSEKKKFFEKNYICSCYNINHILKTLIK